MNEPIDLMRIATEEVVNAEYAVRITGMMNESFDASILHQDAQSRLMMAHDTLNRVTRLAIELDQAQ